MQATDRSKSSHLGYDNLAIYRMVVLLAIGTLNLQAMEMDVTQVAVQDDHATAGNRTLHRVFPGSRPSPG